jgi:hypothetical protein
MIPWRLVAKYSDAVSRHGPDSTPARDIRRENSDNQYFLDFADSLDAVKRRLGGSGMDRPVLNG